MEELTREDRVEIERSIAEYKKQEIAKTASSEVAIPKTPDGRNADEDLEQVISEQATPNKREARKIKHKIKGIWRKWRYTALDVKSLEVEKIACQIELERAETQQKLDRMRREEEIAEAKHWLELNKGNLEDIDANTTSKPSKFWYNVRRGCHHITKLSNNIPKIFKNIFWVGLAVIGIILLKHFNVL